MGVPGWRPSWELARCAWFELGQIECSLRMKVSLHLYNETSWCFRLLPASAPDLLCVSAVLKTGSEAIHHSEQGQRKRQRGYKWIVSLDGYKPRDPLSFPWYFPYRRYGDICFNKPNRVLTLETYHLCCMSLAQQAMPRLMNKKVLDELCAMFSLLCVRASLSLCLEPYFQLIQPSW